MPPSVLALTDLLDVLAAIAPFDLAESWDNVGLMVGDPAQEVTGVLVGLDPTEELLEEALAVGANVVVTHHPLIFKPLKSLRLDEPGGSLLARACRHGVAIVGCHTNLDLADGGVNDALAAALGLAETQTLAPLDRPGEAGGEAVGFGRLGCYPVPLARQEFVERLSAVLGATLIRVAGHLPEAIETVAVCGGSGSELAESAWRRGAQVYVTGEVKLSTARWAEARGLCIVDGGHYATENVVVAPLAAALDNELAGRGLSVPVRVTSRQQDPFGYYCASQPQVRDGRIAE